MPNALINKKQDLGSELSSETLSLKREPLYLVIANQLRSLILRAELKPGSRVQEQYLSELFEVSRTPLREALKLIAKEGLIELLPNKGARITDVDVDELQEIFQVMTSLQELIAAQVLENITDEEIVALTVLQTKMATAVSTGDRDTYFALNQKVHKELSRVAGNRVVGRIEEQLGMKIARARYLANLNADRWLESVDEHAQILTALTNRDHDGLVSAMREHMRNTGKAVIAGFLNASA